MNSCMARDGRAGEDRHIGLFVTTSHLEDWPRRALPEPGSEFATSGRADGGVSTAHRGRGGGVGCTPPPPPPPVGTAGYRGRAQPDEPQTDEPTVSCSILAS